MHVSLKNAPAFYMYDKRDGGYYWECPSMGTRGWKRAQSAQDARKSIARQLAKAKDRIKNLEQVGWNEI